jgi:hypothetical protein
MNQLHCGYYTYNDKIYISRRSLLDDIIADKRNYGLEHDVQFNFNDEVFSKLDWTVEPEIPLKTLYKDRAQQLRDTYEYLILSYSGGSDSHEVLNIFLENGIFIDEIQVVHQYKLVKALPKSVMDEDPALRMWLEFEKVAAPALLKVKQVSPNTKLTLLDASDFIVDDLTTKKYAFLGLDKFDTNATFLVSTTPFARNYFQHQHNSKVTTSSKKTGFIRGTEKPNLKMYRNTLKFSFTDATMHGINLLQNRDMNEIYNIENFFWSPDVPLIPIKQSHIIKNVLENDSLFYAQFMIAQEKAIMHTETNKRGMSGEQDFQRKYIKYIYSYGDEIKFIAPKRTLISPEFVATGILFGETSHHDALKEQKTFYNTKYKSIDDPRLLNRSIDSTRYEIGEINAKWN